MQLQSVSGKSCRKLKKSMNDPDPDAADQIGRRELADFFCKKIPGRGEGPAGTERNNYGCLAK